MQSIHVPSSVVKKTIGRVVLGLLALLGTASATGITLAWQWIVARIDGPAVATMIAPTSLAAQGAAADAHHASSLSNVHQAELALVWRELVYMHAELEVHRRYSKAPDKGALLERARKFYGDAYETDREENKNEPPSFSARRVMRLTWRPDQ
jgi:hypothetical protein